MKCLTVQQPWAWAILRGGKDVENRSRNIAGDYREDLLIHAGIRYAGDEAYHTVTSLSDLVLPALGGPKSDPAFRFESIIGVVELHDVHDPATCANLHDGGPCSPWAVRGQHHLRIRNPRTFKRPVPAKGRLGLWTPDDETLDRVKAQL